MAGINRCLLDGRLHNKESQMLTSLYTDQHAGHVESNMRLTSKLATEKLVK